MNRVNGIPAMGLGTWGRTGPEGAEVIRQALAIGYRHLDTAQSYGTEESVGAALKASGLKREEVFITTKVATVSLARETFLPSFAGSLERLGVDQIDLTLVHWPSPNDAVPFEHYIEDLAEAQARGWTRMIGVSNFTIAHLEKAKRILGPGRIANNQFEVHVYLQNRTLRRYCAENGIAVTCYLPIARAKVLDDPLLLRIAARHSATPAQAALAFLLQQGLIVIPAGGRIRNLAENLGALGLVLDETEMAEIEGLERGERMINPAVPPDWDV